MASTISRQDITMAGGTTVPVYRLNTVILGAGAAGMNCAVHLFEFLSARGVARPQDRIAVVTAGVELGASRMSGSDKQTYYKLGTSPSVADSAQEFVKALTGFGCMHGDIALAEAENSLREFYHLVQAGVPFPHDPEGAYVGYKTDHDPYERATSAGPKTSRFMSERLQAQANRYGIRIFDRHNAVHILTEDRGGRRVVGLVAVDRRRLREPGFGLTVFLCRNLVLAAGGPGALFEVSVYPRGQVGMHGLAFRAGLRAANMTEWQFGLASTRFRWNVSGTYMQVAPRLFSTDRRGRDERDFLCPHFPSMSRMATATFLKGYQWPFDAQRVTGGQSSLIDLLVTHETRGLGRRVYLDFREDPRPGPGMTPFAVSELEPEARTYLERNGAMQRTPIERLRHMNAPAIEIYAEHGIDIAREPLEIDVCAQHHNGGFAVDKWWRASLPGAFVIGEMAATHGVKRPGGAALNSGQVGGLRAAEYIANVLGGELPEAGEFGPAQAGEVERVLARLSRAASNTAGPATPKAAIAAIQRRSTLAAAHLRERSTVERALAEARDQLAAIRREGLRPASRAEVVQVLQAEELAITQVALLEALLDYLARGGGSRGSYMVMGPGATPVKADLLCPWTQAPYGFIAENEALRQDMAEVELADAERMEFSIRHVAPRPVPRRDEAFERMWSKFRSGTIYAE
jgi:succinate dehydrogenase/fumarate reductase flavoprotein subunit